MEPVYHEIGARLRWVREQRGWSSHDLSERLGIHASTIVSWENAIARPGVAEVLRIAHECKVPIEVLLADVDIERCKTPASVLAKRKETARKRVAIMRANGSFERRSKMKAAKKKG